MIEINLIVSFVSGVSIGISPCILLISSVFGSSLVLSEKKEKFFFISFGLLSGIVLAYIIMTTAFLFFFQFFEVITYFKYVFAGIIIFIGAWQIIDSKKEQSIIFGTPTKIKNVLKEFFERNSVLYSFLVGIFFILIKIPCMGTVYLSLIYNFYSNSLLIFYIIAYLVGMLTPTIIILLLIRLNVESSKVDDFRLKYRPYLRMFNGGLLIFLALYLLIF